MAYCPNCAEEIALDAPECPACKATFEGGESWRPLANPPSRAAAAPWFATGLRVGVLVAVWALVVVTLRTSSPPAARKLFELPYVNPFEIPDLPLGLLGLGVGLLAADFAARPFDLGTFRGTITLVRFANLIEGLWTRLGLCILAFPSVVLILCCALFTLVSLSVVSLSSVPPDKVGLLVALGVGGLIGVWAIASGVLLPHNWYRSSKKLYWLTLGGLTVAITTAYPLAHIGSAFAAFVWPGFILVLFARVFVLHYTIVGIFLILALLGGKQREKEENSCAAPLSTGKA